MKRGAPITRIGVSFSIVLKNSYSGVVEVTILLVEIFRDNMLDNRCDISSSSPVALDKRTYGTYYSFK